MKIHGHEQDILEKFARIHMEYEFRMLLGMTELLRSVRGPKYKSTMDLAYFESFLMHARILDEFLSPHCPKSDDITCANYLPCKKSIEKQVLTLDERRAISKQLAHFCIQREGRVGFEIERISCCARNAFMEFLSLLEGPQRSWFSDAESLVTNF